MKGNYLFRMMMAILIAIAFPLTSGAESITYTATYNLAHQIGTDTLGGVTYTTLHYDGMYNDGEPGAPSLPIDYIRFSVPYNATNFTVTSSLGNTFLERLNGPVIYPCQEQRLMSDTVWSITPPDSIIYNSGNLYPPTTAWVVDEGFLAGENHIVTVAVMPVAYRHSNSGLIPIHQLQQSSSVQLTLNYVLSDSPKVYPLIRENDSLRLEGYDLTRTMVVNADSIVAFAPNIDYTIPFYPTFSYNDTLGYDVFTVEDHPYLIVTTSELYSSMRRIAALKRQKGYDVKIVTMDQIMNNPLVNQGDIVKAGDSTYVAYSDSAGALRQYLKNAYKYWGTKYLLLAGNIPYRTYTIDSINYWHGDFYYSELHSNWRNSIQDSLDKEPELYVGRLLSKSPIQVSYYTDKLFRYELNPGHGDFSYLQRALYTEGKDFFKNLDYIKRRMSSTYTNPTMIREIDNGNYPKGLDVIDSINSNQYGLMFSFNHGAPSCIKTYGSDNTGVRYFLWAIDSVKISPSVNDILEIGNGLNNMQNKYHPFIYYCMSCETMPYYKLAGYNIDMNFGESFTMGRDYGGPAFLSNTTDVNTLPVKNIGEGFVNLICSGYYHLGEVETLSKLDNYWDKLKMSICHNLLGDPELELWTSTPEQYTNISVVRTNNSITVSGILNADSTVITYLDNDGRIHTRRASSSTLFCNVSPNGCIMLTKHNHIPYIAPLLIQNDEISNSQYVIASDVTAGNTVDSNRTSGDVIVPNGVEYEIEASGKVTLEDGFKVEKGATFAVYPACY